MYDFPIDLKDLNNVHTQLILLAGHNKIVLEIGCSTGFMSRYLAQNQCSVTGVEIDPKAAEKAKHFCSKVIVGDIESEEVLIKIKGPYDVIILGDVLEHLVNPNFLLDRTKKWLGKDGDLLISIPNVAHWTMRLNMLMGRFDYKSLGMLDRTHLRFFTWKTFFKMLSDAGFTVKEKVVLANPFHQDMPFRILRYFYNNPQIKKWLNRIEHHLAQWVPTLFGVHFIVKAHFNSTHTKTS